MPILTNSKPRKVLIDTCVFIWLMQDDKRLSKNFKTFIQDCQSNNFLFLSPISFWEISMLIKKKRLSLKSKYNEGLESIKLAVKEANLRVFPITLQIGILGGNLQDIHGDPADRLITATALHKKVALATTDERLLSYAKKTTLSTINPFSF